MQCSTKTFTVAMGADLPRAVALGHPCADLIYTFRDGRLCRTGPISRPGSLLGFYLTPGAPAPTDLRALVRTMQAQVRYCRCGGVLLDLPEDAHGLTLAAALSPGLTGSGIPVYLPVTLGSADPNARLLLPSAISGGSLDGMLEHYMALCPPERLCLELVRTRHDFPMPSPDPGGTLLPADRFDDLLQQAGQSHFSPDLCANYFTYADETGRPHLVLFDDADTARRKLDKARALGLCAVFALYAEWGTEIREVFSAESASPT